MEWLKKNHTITCWKSKKRQTKNIIKNAGTKSIDKTNNTLYHFKHNLETYELIIRWQFNNSSVKDYYDVGWGLFYI